MGLNHTQKVWGAPKKTQAVSLHLQGRESRELIDIVREFSQGSLLPST